MANERRKNEGAKPACTINRKLLPSKAFYFTFLAAVGSLLPFIAVYMKQLGLTSDETGVIYGVMPFLSFLVRPLVGGIADRWQKHKAVLISCTILSGVLHLLIMFVPPRTSLTNNTVHVKPVFLQCGLTESLLSSCLGDAGEQRDSDPAETSSDMIGLPSSACAVSLGKLVEVVAFRNTESYETDNDFGKNGAESVANVSAKLSDIRALCSFKCYETIENNRDIQGNESVGVCFTDLDVPHTPQGRCQGLQVHEDPVAFTIERLPRLLNRTKQPENAASSSSCARPYSLKGLDFGGETFEKLTCWDSKTFMCGVECTGVPVSELCETDASRLDVTFGLLFVVSFFAACAFAPVFSLADAIIFDQLGTERHKYGQQRMWGTLGVAIFAVAATFAVNARSDVGGDVNYDVMFYLFAGLCALSGLIASRMKVSSQVRCHSLVKNACQLLALPEVLAFLGVVLYLGMITGAIEGFLFWFLADLGGSPLLFGLCLAVNCAFEIPFFFFSGSIIKRFKPITCLYSSMLVLSVRLLVYSLLSNPWYVLLAESLHGVTFGITWAAVANHAHAISPPGMSASVQGLVGGMNFGVVVLAVYALLNTYALVEKTATERQLNSLVKPHTDKQNKESGTKDEEGCQDDQLIPDKKVDNGSLP